MQIFSIHPLCDEAIVLMPDKNLWGMTALSVLFCQFDCSAERLCFAWESCGHMAMFLICHPPFWFITTYRDLCNASSTLASHNFQKITRGFAASSVAILIEAQGGVTARKQCDGAIN
jgi:hypothetical protein